MIEKKRIYGFCVYSVFFMVSCGKINSSDNTLIHAAKVKETAKNDKSEIPVSNGASTENANANAKPNAEAANNAADTLSGKSNDSEIKIPAVILNPIKPNSDIVKPVSDVKPVLEPIVPPINTAHLIDSHCTTSGLSQGAVGEKAMCVALSDGKGVCFGDEFLGNGKYGGSGAGAQVTLESADKPLEKIFGFANGVIHGCAIFGAERGVRCFGNTFAALGAPVANQGQIFASAQPHAKGVEAISASFESTCAIVRNFSNSKFSEPGKLSCWGNNSSGELGDGGKSQHSTPFYVDLPNVDVSSVSMGKEHTCVTASDGKAFCWGQNGNGRLGDGSQNERLKPMEVVGLAGKAVQVSVGHFHSCALLSDGKVQCWGGNLQGNGGGQLGVGASVQESLKPLTVPDLSDTVWLSSGKYHTCALTKAAKVYCWGNLSQTHRYQTPTLIQGISNVVDLGAGKDSSCAIQSDRKVFCWGDASSVKNGSLNASGDGPNLIKYPGGDAIMGRVTGAKCR